MLKNEYHTQCKKGSLLLVAFIGIFFTFCTKTDAENITQNEQTKGTTMTSVTLNSGYEMPTLGLGTWTLTGKTCEAAVYAALKSGYRLIDTAKYYGNEAEVGNAVRKAVADGICKREDIFLTTKIVPWSNSPDADIDDSLAKLKVAYIDLVLLHQSGSGNDKVYNAMIRAAKKGKIRSIGISNFYTPKSVSYFIDNFEIAPAVVQNENHLFYQNNSLRDWAKSKNIHIESYYPFGGRGHTREHFSNATVASLAKKYGKTSAQIIVRWHLQAGYITIPGSSNPAHIAENFSVWDFSLSTDDMKALEKLNTGKRYESW
ncbi:MAG: aldo/keto reductase [Treponema sp.]|nr:aldo/keto reductase [Treponema sp.]